jgi:hypothetical protein
MSHQSRIPQILPELSATIFSVALLSACASQMAVISMFGDPIPPEGATQTVVITPETQYVNVVEGQAVKFVVNDKTFAWDFNGPSAGYAFDLAQVAPPGLLDHKVEAYVRPNPDYLGGGA